MNALTKVFDEIIDSRLLIRRITLSAHHLLSNELHTSEGKQLCLFSLLDMEGHSSVQRETVDETKEKALQDALISIKKAHGKNAILRGANFIDGATTRQRNNRIGGHKA